MKETLKHMFFCVKEQYIRLEDDLDEYLEEEVTWGNLFWGPHPSKAKEQAQPSTNPSKKLKND